MEAAPNIGLDKASREGVIQLLSVLLSDLHILAAKTRAAHWGVSGLHFHSLHELFGEQYATIDGEIDEVAERIRMLGGTPQGSLGAILSGARLADTDIVRRPASDQVSLLLAEHESLIRSLRASADEAGGKFRDSGTNDFLVGLMEAHEKIAWMLRASAA